jgi:signal transduction histidine kinase
MVHTATSGGLVDLSYRSIIDFLPCYLSVQDRTLQILFTNWAFKNDFGDGIGKHCHQVYKGLPERCPACPVQKTFEDKGSHISEETVHLADGRICRLIVQSAPILNALGDVIAVIELAFNVTKLKEDQRELMFLGQSMAVLSHGIKNILEGLEGGACVIDQGIQSKDMGLSKKGWQIVRKNIQEISMVVQNILYASKKRSLSLQKVSPVDLVGEVRERYRERAEAEGISLRAICGADLSEVTVDPSSIRKMLNNLVLNAMEACRRDSGKQPHSVEIRAGFYDKWHFVVEVADNGIGMDEATQKEIFKDFFSTKGSDGTGLGLAVVDKVVGEHGGKIEVTSSPGLGSTFRVILRNRLSET